MIVLGRRGVAVLLSDGKGGRADVEVSVVDCRHSEMLHLIVFLYWTVVSGVVWIV